MEEVRFETESGGACCLHLPCWSLAETCLGVKGIDASAEGMVSGGIEWGYDSDSERVVPFAATLAADWHEDLREGVMGGRDADGSFSLDRSDPVGLVVVLAARLTDKPIKSSPSSRSVSSVPIFKRSFIRSMTSSTDVVFESMFKFILVMNASTKSSSPL